MRVWRIARAAHSAFDGAGTRRYGSRWTPKGFAAVYTSATLSLAALERFVHTDTDLEPADLVSISVEISAELIVHTIDVDDLPANWREYPAPETLARIGEQWLRKSSSAVLTVPSVLIPHERNYVVNPEHADFDRMKIAQPEPFSFDPRMWNKRRTRA